MNLTEIESSVIRAKEGNEDDLLKLLNQYKPFIIKTAKKFNIICCDTSDLVQVGYIAILNSLQKYNTGSNTFSTYAYNSIKNSFKYTARKHSKFREKLWLNSPANPNENIDTEFINLIRSPINHEEDMLDSEELMELKAALSKLSKDELELITMIYYNNASLKAYADKKGISYQGAIKKKTRIIRKLSSILTIKNTLQ